MKRIFAVLLSLLLILASCGEAAPEEQGTEETGTPAPVSENQAAVPETAAPLTELEKHASVKDSLPERDFGGTEFRIATREGTLY